MSGDEPWRQTPAVNASGDSLGCAVHRVGRAATWLQLTGEFDRAALPRLIAGVDEALDRTWLVLIDVRRVTSPNRERVPAAVRAYGRRRGCEHRIAVIGGRPAPPPARQIEPPAQAIEPPARSEVTQLSSVRREGPRQDEIFVLVPTLRRLPQAQRWVLTMWLVQDMALADIAQFLGCSLSEVTLLLRRGGAALLSLITPEWPRPPLTLLSAGQPTAIMSDSSGSRPSALRADLFTEGEKAGPRARLRPPPGQR
jgi:hypothetical protein